MTEQAESLDMLENAGAALDATANPEPGAAPGEPPPPPVDNAAELLAALTMARALALPIIGGDKGVRLAAVWDDTVLARASAAGAAVMELHGITMSGVLGKYGAYVMLAAALAPPVVETRRILLEPPPKPQEPRREAPPA